MKERNTTPPSGASNNNVHTDSTEVTATPIPQEKIKDKSSDDMLNKNKEVSVKPVIDNGSKPLSPPSANPQKVQGGNDETGATIPIGFGPQGKGQKVKSCKELQDKNSNYIFVFGYTGSGKTTVLATLDLYIRRHYMKTTDPTNNAPGIRHINRIVREISAGRFPKATATGTIIEYDVSIGHENFDEPVNLTFIEMAGEDLKKISTDEEEGDIKLREEINKYLTCPNISIAFLLVADFEERVVKYKEDDLFTNFIGYLKNYCRVELPLDCVGVILSKFDRDISEKTTVREVFNNYMPQTQKHLRSKTFVENGKVFPFSVGEVSRDKSGTVNGISTIDLTDAQNIINWLFKVYNDEPEQRSAFGNFLKF